MKERKQSDYKYRLKTRDFRRDLYSKIGVNCLFCHSTTRLICHRKDFKNHTKLASLTLNQLRQVKVEDYARLCFACHYGVHWVHNFLGLSWEKLVQTMRGAGSNPAPATNIVAKLPNKLPS
jgi:hypothetical protein